MDQRATNLEHRYCFACGTENPDGLALEFVLSKDEEISAVFTPKRIHQGYDDMLHGGIVCTLLDAAMTRLLMSKGITAVTANLNVRFKKPVPITERLVVHARIVKRRERYFQCSADLAVTGSVAATATGKFLRRRKTK
ncbi:MAG: PaaI family thioesterase [Gemmatimonadota bacterium]|nr:MAG: PaaI family thioesterase [Gemmatimonadota bacterium]